MFKLLEFESRRRTTVESSIHIYCIILVCGRKSATTCPRSSNGRHILLRILSMSDHMNKKSVICGLQCCHIAFMHIWTMKGRVKRVTPQQMVWELIRSRCFSVQHSRSEQKFVPFEHANVCIVVEQFSLQCALHIGFVLNFNPSKYYNVWQALQASRLTSITVRIPVWINRDNWPRRTHGSYPDRDVKWDSVIESQWKRGDKEDKWRGRMIGTGREEASLVFSGYAQPQMY